MEKKFTLKLTPEQREEVKKYIGQEVKEVELQEGKTLGDRIAPRAGGAWTAAFPGLAPGEMDK
jgi:hypothetical protein